MRKKALEKRQARLLTKKAELLERSRNSQDINEVRSINEQLTAIAEDLQDIADELAALAAEENNDEAPAEDEASRSAAPAGAEVRGGQVRGSYAAPAAQNVDPRDTEEYRNAFMNFVCRGTAISAELRAATGIADAGAVIPTTLMNDIIKKLETYGNVYALVRKLNVQGGVAIPVLSLKPEAHWIGESNPSEAQKLSANDKITFSYFGIECKLAQTLLASVTTLEAFQTLFVTLAAEAIVKGVEIAIFNGDGVNQPLGITKDTRVAEANVITLTEKEMGSWAAWHKKVKAKMKKAYRNGTFFMNQATFDGHIDGMEDTNGQPVGRTTYGINGEELYRFMGKAVETVEDGCLASFDDAAAGDVIAVFMVPTDYAINSNMQMTAVKWVDHDTNEVKNKCTMIVDGKLVDAHGVLIIKKGQ